MFKTKLKNSLIGYLAVLVTTFCITLTTSETTIAQDGASLVEEIVVTARKREENILDVPLAITALSANDIEDKGIGEFKDIISFTPGFHFAEHSVGRADRSNRILVIRGMHISQENDHQQAATVFVDGAPMHGSVIAGLEDAERIEIVRGPQSAYFGRATLSGAVNYVTKTPGQESKSKIVAEVGKYGTTNLGFSTEGPINDTTAYRIAISSQDTEGQYTAANTPTLKLGARQTVSFAGTLYFEPSDNFNAKLRYHTWEDDDGPGAAFGYGVNNGEALFNCNLPNSSLAARNGTNNWFCGVAPFPQDANIQYDAQMSPNKVSLLTGIPTAGLSIDTITDVPFLHGFGFAREASQASLVMNWSLDSGISITSITASNDNRWMALDDLDRRHNTDVPDSLRDVSLLNGRDLKDFSQEIRVSSPQDQRLRWLLGLSKFSFEGKRTSGFHIFSSVRSLSLGNVFDIDTTGFFAAIEYDITDDLTVNIEGRRQKDDVQEARSSGAEFVSGTFNSTTPRIALDYQMNEDVTLYASYGEGTRPGGFNVNLFGESQPVLDQLALSGIYKEIEEEELEMTEFGIKASLMDGRAWMQAAVYQGDWRAQQAAGAFVGDVFYGGTATGGEIDLSGYEIEGAWAVSDNFKLEATLSNNDSEIKTLTDCADCTVLLGTSDISGMGKRKQRNPKTQRSVSGTLDGQMSNGTEWYLRADLLHTGSSYATDANVTETGSSNRVNMRYGIIKDNLRIELVGENLTNDKTFTNYQFLIDFAYLPPSVNRVLTGGLPDLRYYGVKATYSF
ncbi:MAG: TonB-dependent receptor [Gammaproteobacteria bacterium]|jgi:iron complex outermembrane receptor protein|nr:TonB-dependent receptor [Gammaproteobacteria bacterium]